MRRIPWLRRSAHSPSIRHPCTSDRPEVGSLPTLVDRALQGQGPLSAAVRVHDVRMMRRMPWLRRSAHSPSIRHPCTSDRPEVGSLPTFAIHALDRPECPGRVGGMMKRVAQIAWSRECGTNRVPALRRMCTRRSVRRSAPRRIRPKTIEILTPLTASAGWLRKRRGRSGVCG